MKQVAIIAPLENKVFGELAQALCLSFMDLGWIAMCLSDNEQIKQYRHDIDLAIVLTPFDYPKIKRMLPKSKLLYYQLETMPWPYKIHIKRRKYWKENQIIKLIKQYDFIADHDLGNIKKYWVHYKGRINNKQVIHLPVGYSRIFEYIKKVKEKPRALFIGSTSDHPKYTHRTRTLRYLASKLGRKNFKVVTNRWGQKVRQMAKESLITLNIHQSNIPTFETLRVVGIAMSNRNFVITEPCEYIAPFENTQHLIVVDHKEMPSEIKYYLQTPWERKRIADNAYHFVKKHFTMTQNLEKALKQLRI